jgi:hypothetical protein
MGETAFNWGILRHWGIPMVPFIPRAKWVRGIFHGMIVIAVFNTEGPEMILIQRSPQKGGRGRLHQQKGERTAMTMLAMTMLKIKQVTTLTTS